MAAPKGNRFWEARSSHGRDKIFSSEEILWEAAVEYFEWVESHPLEEARLFKIKDSANLDQIVSETVPKMRAMTIIGLCLFLDVATTTWGQYCKHKDFASITKRIANVIRDQKFGGAAADLLNANIIARDLGLVDKKESKMDVSLTDLSDEELARRLNQLEQTAED